MKSRRSTISNFDNLYIGGTATGEGLPCGAEDAGRVASRPDSDR